MTPEAAHRRALQSLLDVVEELTAGLAAGATPGSDWAEQVRDTFDEHRAEVLDPEGHTEE